MFTQVECNKVGYYKVNLTIEYIVIEYGPY